MTTPSSTTLAIANYEFGIGNAKFVTCKREGYPLKGGETTHFGLSALTVAEDGTSSVGVSAISHERLLKAIRTKTVAARNAFFNNGHPVKMSTAQARALGLDLDDPAIKALVQDYSFGYIKESGLQAGVVFSSKVGGLFLSIQRLTQFAVNAPVIVLQNVPMLTEKLPEIDTLPALDAGTVLSICINHVFRIGKREFTNQQTGERVVLMPWEVPAYSPEWLGGAIVGVGIGRNGVGNRPIYDRFLPLHKLAQQVSGVVCAYPVAENRRTTKAGVGDWSQLTDALVPAV